MAENNNNLFQQAMNAVNRFTNNNNQQGARSQQDKQAARDAIQSAYNGATPEEQQQLSQLEQQLDQNQELK